MNNNQTISDALEILNKKESDYKKSDILMLLVFLISVLMISLNAYQYTKAQDIKEYGETLYLEDSSDTVSKLLNKVVGARIELLREEIKHRDITMALIGGLMLGTILGNFLLRTQRRKELKVMKELVEVIRNRS